MPQPTLEELNALLLPWFLERFGPSGAPSISQRLPQTIAADYVMRPDDGPLLVDASAGHINITLPPPALCAGWSFHVKKIDASENMVSIVGPIEGAPMFDLGSQWSGAIVRSTGEYFISLSRV